MSPPAAIIETALAPRGGAIARRDGLSLPPTIARAGEPAARRFVEFFTAEIRNAYTRRAYAAAAGRFLAWCEAREIALERLEPFLVAAYVEELGRELAPGTVKQHLAALRMLFDYLVVGQVLADRPAARRFVEFFTAEIRNAYTRRAYAAWRDAQSLAPRAAPFVVATDL